MVSPLSTPAILENPRSKRHDTTIFVERLQNRSSSSVVPTSNPPTLTPAVPNPEARPKKSSRRCVPPPPESVPTGTGTPLVTLLALQKNTMILLQTMVFLLIVLQPRQLLQLLPLLTLLALFVNRIMNHLLIPVSKLLRVTLEDFISNVSDHISVTWDVQIDPDKLDLRWHDSSGDTFVLRNTNLCHLLHMHRPQWCQHQDTGNLFPPRPFADFNELCIILASPRDLRMASEHETDDPAGNESILSALNTASPVSPDLSPLSSESLNHDGFAHLAAHLAILANVLAQDRAASSEIPDDNST
ncbi:unnamed protein product [Cladocopium goreaui]|uniref:Uncharacterized protein n=1 Tax=Cladocopium goreaui TaxID=2562237 RepID=A0A9P1DK73_9DINO|nr:unnamed protein product [Cladocopium goreaui]